MDKPILNPSLCTLAGLWVCLDQSCRDLLEDWVGHLLITVESVFVELHLQDKLKCSDFSKHIALVSFQWNGR